MSFDSSTDNLNKCDVCGKTELETAIFIGRWLFYCAEHKKNDMLKTYDNEIAPSVEDGDMDFILADGELSEVFTSQFI